MTDAELRDGYEKYFRTLPWEDLVEQTNTYIDFPRMRLKDGDIAEMAFAEQNRRVREGRTS